MTVLLVCYLNGPGYVELWGLEALPLYKIFHFTRNLARLSRVKFNIVTEDPRLHRYISGDAERDASRMLEILFEDPRTTAKRIATWANGLEGKGWMVETGALHYQDSPTTGEQ